MRYVCAELRARLGGGEQRQPAGSTATTRVFALRCLSTSPTPTPVPQTSTYFAPRAEFDL